MATTPSNRFDFAMTLEEMIREAAQFAGGGPLDGEQLLSYINSFNIIQQDIVNRGYPLSLLLQGTITVCTSCTEYELDKQIYDIHNMVVRESGDATDIRMERLSLAEFNELPNKATTGRPTTYTVERRHEKVALRIWPTPDETYTLYMYVFTKPDDLYKYTDTVRMSPRLYPALIAGMSLQIAMKRGAPLDRIGYLEAYYEKMLSNAYHEDRERSSFFITPSLNIRSR